MIMYYHAVSEIDELLWPIPNTVIPVGGILTESANVSPNAGIPKRWREIVKRGWRGLRKG